VILVLLTAVLIGACTSADKPPIAAPPAPTPVTAAPETAGPHMVDVRWLRRTLSEEEAAAYVGDAACRS